uniref:Sushi domain-containing protein n=1 Tax=Neogobius melanostomus TaxID=47308 RepID=A0A8C6S9M7_9GOBI
MGPFCVEFESSPRVCVGYLRFPLPLKTSTIESVHGDNGWKLAHGYNLVWPARNQNCPTPVIENGFFIPERDTLSYDTELYYSCDEDFNPVEGSWWAAVTCQNGNWSSIPECDTACFEPVIPNANYTAFQYVKNNEKIRIRCNTGYEDKKKRARAICQNGQWTELPVCEKMDSWCGPPPQIPNAVIINHGYEEMFQEDAYVEYMCKSNFELETNSNRAYCSYGQWLTPPSCRQKQTNQGRDPPATTGAVDILPPNFYKIILLYKCNYYYKLKGERIVRCANGNWTQPPTCEGTDSLLENKMKLPCFDSTWKTARAECRDNQLHLSECKCNTYAVRQRTVGYGPVLDSKGVVYSCR